MTAWMDWKADRPWRLPVLRTESPVQARPEPEPRSAPSNGGTLPQILSRSTQFQRGQLTSFEAIMKGAFSKTRKKQGKPGIPIVTPFDLDASPLVQLG
ncbi:MAG TPA: hypothetical protein QGG18_07830 [Rhodospirillales bacterium]|nr:hypothetical protein [Rhodospirillales bacterium]